MTPLTPEALRRAVRQVVADYEGFLARPPREAEEDPKAFTARHAAARSALAHLEHLMKFDHGGAETEALAEASALMAEAQRSIRLAEQEDGEETTEDDGIA